METKEEILEKGIKGSGIFYSNKNYAIIQLNSPVSQVWQAGIDIIFRCCKI